jgi:hypothetical protein
MVVRVLASVALACLFCLPCAAAPRDYGEGFGIGGVLLPDGNPMILGTSRLGDSLSLEVGIGLDVFSNDDDSSSDFAFRAGMRKFWNVDGQFQPFFGGRVSLLHLERDRGDHPSVEDTLFGFGAALGGEYFVTRRVSLLGEVGVGLFFGSIELRTGSSLAAFMYL